MRAATSGQDGVIFLHGIFRTARSMRALCRFIEKHGYRTLNVDYPSTRQTMEEIIRTIEPSIREFCDSVPGRVHFVGYSMGGLLIRRLLAAHRPANLGRVVMLGTPNHGSEVADFLKDRHLYKKFYGPAGQQLTTGKNRSPHEAVDYELGILAGNRTLDPFCYFLIKPPHDGKVSVASTELAGMKEHRTIKATHTFFPVNREAWKQTLQFLKTGSFA